ncbi:YceI family protein [bacterium BMS3Abin03]|jgi:polyisoprenoid-binding protein YceI|nr:YceI family protein [bacterium BMS3Abin03]
MKFMIRLFIILIISSVILFAQGFKVKATGEKTFTFLNDNPRNQATFFSTTPFEDFTGLTDDIKGTATFNVSDISTLKGSFVVTVASMKTGIALRDKDMKSEEWLDAEEYPEITFTIKKVSDIKTIEDNKLQAEVTGDFTVHGVTKDIVTDATMTYLDENEKTRAVAPGDLLGVEAKFTITLSDYDVDNIVLGRKVSDKIDVTVNLVGSSGK